MYRLSSLILLLGLGFVAYAQSPHGALLKLDCGDCHTTTGWDIPASVWQQARDDKTKKDAPAGEKLNLRFDHNSTLFPLTGRHELVDCRACHESLVFSEADPACVSCHTDMHQQTVGMDCARCHSTENWLVDNIPELHIDNGFPLLGAHAAANCFDCHLSETQLRFDRIGNDCINCHRDDYEATTSPNHAQAGFSTNCTDCHDPAKPDWGTTLVDHSFFPLEKGHDLADCAACHTGGTFTNTPTDCFACHQADYASALNPNHQGTNFSTTCTECHTTDPGWMPASFQRHDADYFPIYSGKHAGEWTACVDCHKNPANYAEFTCISCHEKNETDDEHDDVGGYIYEDNACLACHPTGDADLVFDHNTTAFPLTGQHQGAACIDCHASGYAGTPTACAACHNPDYEQSSNPDHGALGIPTDCATCHSTAGWTPAEFPIHDDYYALNGAHAVIANDCAACHNGNYANTPNTCAGCHQPDYDAATNPSHSANQFPTDCANCHNETAWAPSTFNHDDAWPLTGAHTAVPNCTDCHIGGNYTATPNTCAGCHQPDFDASTNPNHNAIGIPTDCETCHTTAGWAPAEFPIHHNYFQLNGVHETTDCVACHNGNYTATPNTCFGCHQADYEATVNPNHQAAQFNTDCALCHNEATWSPSTFDHDNQHFPIFSGKHMGEWAQCTDCHTNPANNQEFQWRLFRKVCQMIER